MKRSLKRGLFISGAVLLALIAIPIGMIASAFIGMRALAPREFGSDSVLKDGFVCIGVIDEGDGHLALIDAGNDPAGTADPGGAQAARPGARGGARHLPHPRPS